MKKYLICILQHRNTNYAITAFFHLVKALREQPELIDQCKIVIAASAHGNSELAKLKQYYSEEFDLEIFECNPSYAQKIKSVIEKYPPQKFTYFIKHDEDLFLPSDTWKKFLTLSPEQLHKSNALLTTVNLSTGIPTWSMFAETFFNNYLRNEIYEKLSSDSLPETAWGNDYREVNKAIRLMPRWNEQAYWETINNLPYDYKGIHPVRVKIWYGKRINEEIVTHYGELQKAHSGQTFTEIRDRYFCNSFFMMNYAMYESIFNTKSLYVDEFDEVPVNRYMQKNGLAMLVLNDSLGVHIMYNSVYDQKIRYQGKTYRGNALEEKFSEDYFNLIVSSTALHDKNAMHFIFQKTPIQEVLRRHAVQNTAYRKLRAFLAQSSILKSTYKKLKSLRK